MYQKLNPKHNRSDSRAGDSKCKGSRFKPRLDPMRPTLKHMDTNDETIRLWAKTFCGIIAHITMMPWHLQRNRQYILLITLALFGKRERES